MSIASKLLYLYQTKLAIKEALKNKGAVIDDSDTFRSYVDSINGLELEDPENVERLNFYKSIFYRDFGDGNLVIPDYVTSISPFQFAESDIISIVLPEGIKEIQNSSFKSCKSLENINLENIEVMGEYAFYGCSNLGNLELTNIISIADYAFNSCYSTSELKIGNKIEHISNPSSSLRRPFATSLKTIIIDKPYGSMGVPSHHWGATSSTIYWNDGVQTPPNESVNKVL